MSEQQLRDYLATLTLNQIVEIAVELFNDAARLRHELDDAKGIVR